MKRGKAGSTHCKSVLSMYRTDLEASHLELSRAEVEAIAKEWQETRNPELRDKLVLSCLKWAVKLANRYARVYRQTHNILDLIQEANFGLIDATEDFDYRLNSFVGWTKSHIKKRITAYLVDNALIRVPANAYYGAGKLRTAKENGDSEINLEELFWENVSPETVAAAEQMLATSFISTSDHVSKNNGRSSGRLVGDTLATEDRGEIGMLLDQVSRPKLHLEVSKFLEKETQLSPKNKQVVQYLFGSAIKLGEINISKTARAFGMNQQRVNQLHKKVLENPAFLAIVRNCYPLHGQKLSLPNAESDSALARF